MARRIALLLTLTSWNCAQAQIAPEPPVTVPAFTRVEVKLEEQISSKTNHTGDRFKLTITNVAYIDDFLTPSNKATFESIKPKLTDVTGKHIAGAREPQTSPQ